MDITELGAGAVFAYIIIKEVLSFLKAPKSKEQDHKIDQRLHFLEQGVSTLVEQHATKDEDGRPVWWRNSHINKW